MSDIRTCIWFDGRIDEAAELYVSLIPDSRITSRTEYPSPDQSPGPDRAGQPLMIELELGGVPYLLLNGGPQFPLTEAVSISVTVDTQADLDRIWDGLVAGGGEESMCGWCRDRFGLSWQITPRILMQLVQGPKAAEANAAMYAMRRLDVATFERIAAGQ